MMTESMYTRAQQRAAMRKGARVPGSAWALVAGLVLTLGAVWLLGRG